MRRRETLSGAQVKEGGEIGEGVGKESRIVARITRKPLEPHPGEHSDTARRGQRRDVRWHVPMFERDGDRVGQVREFREFPLLQLRCR